MDSVESYNILAKIYDKIQESEEERVWFHDLQDITDRLSHLFNKKSLDILDLGCGTGSFAANLAKEGHRILAVDNCQAMLLQAGMKWEKLKANLLGASAIADEDGEESHRLYLKKQSLDQALRLQKQDLRSLNIIDMQADNKLGFDFAYCLYDTLNHLQAHELKHLLQDLQSLLRPGAYFLFDLLSSDYIAEELADFSYAEQFENEALFWDSFYNDNAKIITHKFTYFEKYHNESKPVDEDLFRRFFCSLDEYYHDPLQIESLLKKYHFEIQALPYQDFGSSAERLVYLCVYKP